MRMCIFNIISFISILALKLNIVCTHLNLKSNIDHVSEVESITKHLFDQYLSRKIHNIGVIIEDMSFNLLTNNILAYISARNTLRLLVFKYIDGNKKVFFSRSVNISMEEGGYIFISNKFNTSKIQKSFDNIMGYNALSTEAYFIYVLTSDPQKCLNEMKTQFEYFWNNYRILNLVMVYWTDYNYDNTSITKSFSSAGSVYILSYNQFNSHLKQFAINQSLSCGIMSNVFVDKLRNLYGYSLNVSLFVHAPMVIKTVDKLGKIRITGSHGNGISLIMAQMNATPNYLSPSDGKMYGLIKSNGLLSGALRDVVEGLSEVCGNSDLLTSKIMKYVKFTFPCNLDCITFLVPKSKEYPEYMNIILPFPPEIWAIYLGTFPVLALFWALIVGWNSMQNLFHNKWDILEMFRIFVYGFTMSKLNQFSHKLYFVSCSVFTILITNSYQGSLSSYLTVPNYYKDINTLEQLYDSKLDILLFQVSAAEFYPQQEDKFLNYFEKHKKKIYDFEDALFSVAQFRNASVLITGFLGNYLNRKMGNFYGERPMLHLMQECLMTSRLSFFVNMNSPYFKRFNNITLQIYESGFFSKWKEDYIYEASLIGSKNYTYISPESLYIGHLQTPFYMLVIGIMLGTAAFIGELVNGFIRNHVIFSNKQERISRI